MSYRFMRTIVFFDLPMETAEDKREYRKFRQLLIKNGFVMMQKSVYCRMLINAAAEQFVLETIRKNKPANGLTQILSVTEKQFSKIEIVTGDCKSDVITTDERLLIL